MNGKKKSASDEPNVKQQMNASSHAAAVDSMKATIHLSAPVKVEPPITHGDGITDPRSSDPS